MASFIGRDSQIADLKRLLIKKGASMAVIRGRRRIGKSRLAEEFSAEFPTAFFFSGLPPHEGTTATTQREVFARQMAQQKVPNFKSDDWSDLFHELAHHTRKGRVLVVLDEITWMGNKDPSFLPKLKTAWDLHFKKNPKLVLLLSGSNSYWIEKNILSSTGFLGRISYRLELGELSLAECNEFWGQYKAKISAYEKFKLLSITGGVPRYLEEIDPKLTAEENILKLCFTNQGILVHEFDEIFSDLFSRKGARYKEICKTLGNGPATLDEVATRLGRKKGGDLSEALEELHEAGFVSRRLLVATIDRQTTASGQVPPERQLCALLSQNDRTQPVKNCRRHNATSPHRLAYHRWLPV